MWVYLFNKHICEKTTTFCVIFAKILTPLLPRPIIDIFIICCITCYVFPWHISVGMKLLFHKLILRMHKTIMYVELLKDHTNIIMCMFYDEKRNMHHYEKH